MTFASSRDASSPSPDASATSATPDASAAPIRLGALEQQVMDLLWDHDPLTVRQIIDLSPSAPAYTTIATVLTNLERKGLVQRQRQGRSVFHAPVVSREQHTARLMQTALANGGDRAASILHFVEGIDDGDIALLRGYLESKSDSDAPADPGVPSGPEVPGESR